MMQILSRWPSQVTSVMSLTVGLGKDAFGLVLMGMCKLSKLTLARYLLYSWAKQFHFSKYILQVGWHIFPIPDIYRDVHCVLFVFIKD